MKREFQITMPLAGALFLTVQAENEDEAKEKFYEKVNSTDVRIEFNHDELNKIGADVEWDFYEKITSGNVCHCQYHDMEIEDNGEIDSEDEE